MILPKQHWLKTAIGILAIIILFSPIYLPLIYEPRRSSYYPYEIIVYIGSLLILGLLSRKFDKTS